MPYALRKMDGFYVSKWYESTINEKLEFTNDPRYAQVFPNMPKAHGFLKHYHLDKQGFALWQTTQEPKVEGKIKKMEKFSV